jgi:hypothetical protein
MKWLILLLMISCAENEPHIVNMTKYEWDTMERRCTKLCDVFECTNERGYEFHQIRMTKEKEEPFYDKSCVCSCNIRNDVWYKEIDLVY